MRVVSETDRLVQRLSRRTVMTMPGEIGVTGSPGLREALLAVISQQRAAVMSSIPDLLGP